MLPSGKLLSTLGNRTLDHLGLLVEMKHFLLNIFFVLLFCCFSHRNIGISESLCGEYYIIFK